MAEHKQVSLSAPGLASVMHDYYKNQPNGEATLEQKIAILDGKAKLPSGSTIRLDCNPGFEPPVGNVKAWEKDGKPGLLEFPEWHWTLFKEGVEEPVASGVIDGNAYAIDGFVGLQSPERPAEEGGAFLLSKGYAPWFGLDAWSGKHRIEVLVKHSGLVSGKLVFPWVESA